MSDTKSVPYYGTQGGGTAIMVNGLLVWETPPDWLDDAKPGDAVNEDWGIIGPFDRVTHLPFVSGELASP
jgi:hypothetical protein